MLLILADPRDEGAHFLADRWSSLGARMVVPRDLSTVGWRHTMGDSSEQWAVASGERVRTRDVTGVLVRMPWVFEENLPHIALEDRSYVAAEMNAFLTAWLFALTSIVLNRPTTSSLLGPNLSHERWLVAAARAGLRIPLQNCRFPRLEQPHACFAVTVVADQWFGDVSAALGRQAVRLAKLVGAELLTAHFDRQDPDATFDSAELLIDPTSEAVADALFDRFAGVRA